MKTTLSQFHRLIDHQISQGAYANADEGCALCKHRSPLLGAVQLAMGPSDENVSTFFDKNKSKTAPHFYLRLLLARFGVLPGYLDGSVKGPKRKQFVQSFQRPGCGAFRVGLGTLGAGAVGTWGPG